MLAKRKRNPMPSGAKWGLIAAGGAAVALVGYLIYRAAQPKSIDVALNPGAQFVGGFSPPEQITLSLPSGKIWASLTLNGTAVPVTPGSSSAVVFSPSSPAGAFTATWTDATGANPQTAVLTYGP